MSPLKEYQIQYQKIPKVFIFIPKKNGKPCIDVGCYWYVYFYYYHNGKRKMFKYYKNINRIDSVAGRMKAAKNLKKAIEHFLFSGGNPLLKTKNNNFTIIEALNFGFEQKKIEWSQRTESTNKIFFEKFIAWINKNDLQDYSIKSLKKEHITYFLNDLKKQNLSNTYINNNKRFLSSLFTKLSSDNIIDYNFVKEIKNLKETPEKNKTFSLQQLKEIKTFVKQNDFPLYLFLQFMTYTFLRPVEIIRLKVGNIDLRKKIIYVDTKTEKSIIPIIETLYKIIDEKHLTNFDKNYYLITYKGFPFNWQAVESTRYGNFKKRFLKVKKHFNLGNDYGLYSFRHTFAKLLYKKYLQDGLTDLQAKQKLMTITRHKSISSLNKYLRNIGAFVPDDYSDDYTFEF